MTLIKNYMTDTKLVPKSHIMTLPSCMILWFDFPLYGVE